MSLASSELNMFKNWKSQNFDFSVFSHHFSSRCPPPVPIPSLCLDPMRPNLDKKNMYKTLLACLDTLTHVSDILEPKINKKRKSQNFDFLGFFHVFSDQWVPVPPPSSDSPTPWPRLFRFRRGSPTGKVLYLRAPKELSGQPVQWYIIPMSVARMEMKYLPYGASGVRSGAVPFFLQINEN